MVAFRFHQYQVVGRALPTENDDHPKIYRMKLWATNEVRSKSKFWYFLRKLKKVKKSNGQILAINEVCVIRHALLVVLSWHHFLALNVEGFLGKVITVLILCYLPTWISCSNLNCTFSLIEGKSILAGYSTLVKVSVDNLFQYFFVIRILVLGLGGSLKGNIFEKNPTKIKNFGIWLRYQSRTGYHNMYKEYRDTTLNGAVEQMYTEMASRHRVRFPCIQIIKTATIPAKLCKRESTKQFHNSKIKFPLVFKKVRPPTRKLKTTYKASRPNLFIYPYFGEKGIRASPLTRIMLRRHNLKINEQRNTVHLLIAFNLFASFSFPDELASMKCESNVRKRENNQLTQRDPPNSDKADDSKFQPFKDDLELQIPENEEHWSA
ncbi:hypothetical protein SADUNF_Sadunf05G0149600 [Salix dunnii]|uniref:Large ribosomal subunit protein eL20 domain-containing protein n=1 Tax=Salix dunnii TaxID=1413687 RepID=A0A835N2B8_9ROSI|nr:hypothetical protein SADUNF_Sadunf05G0149600 [Salix dunnii]